MCQKHFNSYWWKKRDDRFVTMSTPWITQISPNSLRCGDSQGWSSFAAIEEIVASCEPWPWSTDRFAVTVVICSVDNNNTTVGHLSREFSRLLGHFLTHRGGEMNAESDSRSPLIPGRLKIPCYVTLHGKLVKQARRIIAGENKIE